MMGLESYIRQGKELELEEDELLNFARYERNQSCTRTGEASQGCGTYKKTSSEN